LFRFVAIEFGAEAAAADGTRRICPGETNCSDFESAAGANRLAKERNACAGCEHFPTKIAPEKTAAAAVWLDQRESNIIRLFWETRAGYRPEKSELSSVEYMGLVFLAEQWNRRERILQIEIAELAKAMLKRQIF
jgi:hypothetical protein